MTIVFKDSISSTYQIEYTTVVTAIEGTVNNKVDYSGKNLEIETIETTELRAEQFSYVGGDWDPALGRIKVIKVDQAGNTITSSQAKFVLWYKLNGEDVKFGDMEFETTNGELEIGNLPLARTYYLEEVSAPNGYIKSDQRFEIKVEEAANKKVYQQEVENKKFQITGTKVWLGGPRVKPTIKLQLYRNGEAYGEPVELKDGTTSYTWKNLQTSDSSGRDYIYTVDEVEIPNNYVKENPADGLTVTNRYNPPTPPSDEEGRIRIIKRDRDTNDLLSGAEFDIFDSAGRKVDTLITNSAGVATSGLLAVGDYIIQEAKAPEGYRLDSKLGGGKVLDGETLEIVIYNRIQTPDRPTRPDRPRRPDRPDETEEVEIEEAEVPATPVEPTLPEEPSTPSQPEETVDVDQDLPEAPASEEQTKAVLPKTGSNPMTILWILGVVALASGLFLRFKKKIN